MTTSIQAEQKLKGIAVTSTHAELLYHLGERDAKTIMIPFTEEQLKIINDHIKNGYSIFNFSPFYE